MILAGSLDFLARAACEKSGAAEPALGRRLVGRPQRAGFEGHIGAHDAGVVFDQRNANEEGALGKLCTNVVTPQNVVDRRGLGQRFVFGPQSQRLDRVTDKIPLSFCSRRDARKVRKGNAEGTVSILMNDGEVAPFRRSVIYRLSRSRPKPFNAHLYTHSCQSVQEKAVHLAPQLYREVIAHAA